MFFSKILFFTFFLPIISISKPVFSENPETGSKLLSMAREAEDQGETTQALDYYQKARIGLNDHENTLLIYIFNKISYLKSKNYESKTAKVYLDSAQDLLLEKQYENDTLIAQTYFTLGVYFDYSGQLDSALYYHQQALNLRKSFEKNDPIAVANSLQNIGEVYLYGYLNYYEAEQNLEPALRIWEKYKGTERLTTSCYYNLAVANRRKGEFLKALSYAYKTLNANKNSTIPNPYNIMASYSLIGSIYHDMGEPKSALVYNDTAIALSEENDLKEFLPLHYNNHGTYFLTAKQYDSTIVYGKKALTIPSNQINLANSYHLLGNAYQMQHATQRAFLNFYKSLKIKCAIYPPRNSQLGNLYLDMGETYAEIRQWDSAQYYYNQALYSAMLSRGNTTLPSQNNVTLREGDDLNLGVKTLQNKANLLLQRYKNDAEISSLNEAFQQYRLFDQAVDLNRFSFDMEGSKLILSETVKQTYENAIECGYQLFQITHDARLMNSILTFMEKNKAMILYESVLKTEAYEKSLPDSLYLKERSLQAQLAFYRSELGNIQTQPNNSVALIACHNKIAETERSIQRLNYLIQDAFPNYYQVRYGNEMVGMDTIQNHLSAGQAIISYFWGDSAVYTLVISNQVATVHKITEMAALKEAVNTYQTLLTEKYKDDREYENFVVYQEKAFRLFNFLLAPYLQNLSVHQLTLVPDGPLNAIPFESLITHTVESAYTNYKKLPYLIYQYEIVSEFSLNLAFRAIFNRNPGAGQDELKVVAFGIQQFNFMNTGSTRYVSLPGVKKEIQHIQEIFPEASIFLDQQATESSFKKNAADADILHLATHGKANIDNPFLSNFTFARDSSGENDGMLNLYEIYGTSLKAKLLVLSACESGVGKNYPGEGNYSLARSFIYAGCQSVIMTLWSIQDEVTNELIQNFYNQLRQTGQVATALRQTKLEYLASADEMGARPQLWAGLVLLGKAEIRFQKSHSYPMIGGIVLLLIILMVILIRKPMWHRLNRPQVHN